METKTVNTVNPCRDPDTAETPYTSIEPMVVLLVLKIIEAAGSIYGPLQPKRKILYTSQLERLNVLAPNMTCLACPVLLFRILRPRNGLEYLYRLERAHWKQFDIEDWYGLEPRETESISYFEVCYSQEGIEVVKNPVVADLEEFYMVLNTSTVAVEGGRKETQLLKSHGNTGRKTVLSKRNLHWMKNNSGTKVEDSKEIKSIDGEFKSLWRIA
eukprot:Gb_14646 [translate_table: standard]